MTDRPEILMPSPMPARVLERLEARFVLHRLWEQDEPEALIERVAPRIRGLSGSALAGGIGADWFDRLPALEIVANFGVGYDKIDVAAAAARGIMVTNTPGVLDEEVADLAIGLLLATLRRIPQADRYLREGHWHDAPFPLSPSLRGRRVGILGFGNIGQAIARRLEGFDVPIAYHRRSRQPDAPYDYHDSPQALAAASDVLIVIVPGGASTRHLVDAGVLEALGPDGVLVNVARGTVVDESALVHALQSGTIGGAGLDVFDHEPAVPDALIAMENVVLLPHVGSGSERTREAMAQRVADNLLSWFDTGKPVTPVPETQHVVRRSA